MITLTTENFDEQINAESGIVLVDLWAEWCGPCKMLSPIIDEIEITYADKIKVGKINTDENPELAQRFSTSSIPTLMIFKNGECVDRLIGAYPKSRIEKFIDRVFEMSVG